MVNLVDREVGEIRGLLQELGIADKTFIFFTGDNGGHEYFADTDHPRGLFGPNVNPKTGVEYRGRKGNLYEGGLRVPAIAHWPGRVTAGRVSQHLNEHLGKRRRPRLQTVAEEDLEGFFRAYPSRCRHRGSHEEHVRRVRWSVNRFVQYLKRQDRFVDSAPPPIYAPLRDAYQQSLRHLHPRTQDNRCSVVRQFCEYLSRTDPRRYVPERQRATRAADARVHHIYSLTEVQSLLAAAARLPPVNSLRPHTHQTLPGLLYCTGLRVGEAFASNLEDFHDDDAPRLDIAQGKFRKARWVPLSDSVSQALRQYVHRRQTFGPAAPDSPLFVNQRSDRLHHPAVYRTFRQLLSQCKIPHHPDTGPRLHDLRHYAACRIMPTCLLA